MVQRLIAKGADIYNRENAYGATPLSWAQHNKQDEVFAWLRANTRVDTHDGVGFHLLEVVEARLRDDPASVNKRLDHWDTPQSTPLYWAAWTKFYDNDGEHYWNEAERYALVQRLLDAGADVNIVAGDGYTALDVALTAGAQTISQLLRAHGGKQAAEL